VTFADLVGGEQLFLDANPLVYHFGSHPLWGPASTQLVQRIENQELAAFTSTHVLSEAAHHLMTLEAATHFGWTSKVVQHLKQQPASIQQLGAFRLAVEKVPQLGIRVLAIPPDMIATAAALSQQYGLLSNDALIVAVMRANGLTNLARHDADFDRVPGLTRYAPA
jgi:predicted nucleic acid-binding protein